MRKIQQPQTILERYLVGVRTKALEARKHVTRGNFSSAEEIIGGAAELYRLMERQANTFINRGVPESEVSPYLIQATNTIQATQLYIEESKQDGAR